MKKGLLFVAVAFIFAVTTGVAIGQPRETNIHKRIELQQKRIDQGIRSGQLTRPEARTVQGNLDRIKAAAARSQADGRLDPKEHARLERMLDSNDRQIAKEKNDPIRRLE